MKTPKQTRHTRLLPTRNQAVNIQRAIEAIGGLKHGRKSTAARAWGISPSMVNRLLREETRVTPDLAHLIQETTKGKVTVHDFYKDLKSA